MSIPNMSDLLFLFIGGFIFVLILSFALSRPKRSIWTEKCPYCDADLGPKFKGERLTTCRKCKHDLYTTKPHSS